MTVQEFFEAGKLVIITITSPEEDYGVRMLLHQNGYTWRRGQSFAELSYWRSHFRTDPGSPGIGLRNDRMWLELPSTPEGWKRIAERSVIVAAHEFLADNEPGAYLFVFSLPETEPQKIKKTKRKKEQ